jgi:hypothetical protein
MLLPWFQWFEAMWLGNAIRTSLWLFPVIEAVHLLGLCVLGGTVLIVDLRMLGFGLKRHTIAQLAHDAKPWLVASIVVMLATGTALFLSESVKCYYSQSFWVKIITIPLAILFTFTIREWTVRKGALDPTGRTRLVALASLTLWFVIAAAGRWIGFS